MITIPHPQTKTVYSIPIDKISNSYIELRVTYKHCMVEYSVPEYKNRLLSSQIFNNDDMEKAA